MNRQQRRETMKNADRTLYEMSRELTNLKTSHKRLVEENQGMKNAVEFNKTTIDSLNEQLQEARELIARLTQQIEESGKSYMWTIGSIAKANGGQVRIPFSAIDSVNPSDGIATWMDDMNGCMVVEIRPKGSEAPTGIVLPGRSR